jgi:hypothetical protein
MCNATLTMLKPLHIICLLALLGVGLVSCKDDTCDKPQQPQFVIIKDTAEIEIEDYSINPVVSTLPYDNGTLIYDIDNNGIPDIKAVQSLIDSSDGIIYDIETFYNLSTDSSLEFSYRPSWNLAFPYDKLRNHDIGDTLDESLSWSHKSSFEIKQYEFFSNGESFYMWNHKYAAFRKRVGNRYKYGWIKVSHTYGPSVMQR